uniref:Uncharacterized protein n=1 Tax=Peronospora matthiolae TaxID=2874970 RepID=A0AAV1TTZ9_9STRA
MTELMGGGEDGGVLRNGEMRADMMLTDVDSERAPQDES